MLTKKVSVSLAETLVVNMVCYYIFFVWQSNQDVYLLLNPHPSFLLSLLVGARYGNVAGLISSLVSCLFYIYAHFEVNHNIGNVFTYFQYYKFLLMFIMGAVLTGYIKDKLDIRSELQKHEISLLTESYKHLKKNHHDLEKTQQELKKQIINSEESILHLYEIASRLDTLDMEGVYTETVGILKKYLKADTISIYSYIEESRYLRLKLKIGQGGFDKRSIDIGSSKGFTMVTEEKRAIRWNEVKEDQFALMSAPIMKDDKILAVVNIEKMDFDKLSEYAFQLFKLIIDWVNKALSQAIYVDELKESKYIPQTNWLRYDYFIERLKEEERRLQEFGMEFCLLNFILEQHEEPRSLSEVLSGYLRSVDVVGYDEQRGVLYILLPATPKNDLIVVEQRILSKMGHLLGRIGDQDLMEPLTQPYVAEAAPAFDDTPMEVSEENLAPGQNPQETEIIDRISDEETADEETIIEETIVEEKMIDQVMVHEEGLDEKESHIPSAKELLIEGMHLVKTQNFSEAVQYFKRVLKAEPELEIKFLTISELCSLYQQLGLYNLAIDIITVHSQDYQLKNHPGMIRLMQKSLYIQCLITLLVKYDCGPMPYDHISEGIKKEAFVMYLKKAS